MTSVGAPLAGMNDLNLGIHLHKHTKQPTLLKTSLSCSVNYFVINHNLARSPDARRARRESMTPCMQAVIIPYSRDSFIRNEYSTHQTSSAANLRLSMRALIINLPAHDEPYSGCRLAVANDLVEQLVTPCSPNCISATKRRVVPNQHVPIRQY